MRRRAGGLHHSLSPSPSPSSAPASSVLPPATPPPMPAAPSHAAAHRALHRTPRPPTPACLLAFLCCSLLCATRDAVAFSCERCKWEARIDADLGRFHKGITGELLEEAQKQPCGGYLVSIVQGQLYAFPLGWATKHWPWSANHPVLLMISRMLCTYKGLPPVTFVVNAFDRLCSTANHPVPTLSWGKDLIGDDSQILMPYWTFLDLEHQLKDINSGPPWEQRKNLAFWRGTTTGGFYAAWNWRNYPRSRLVAICNTSKLCDAKFSGYPQATTQAEAGIRASGWHGEHVDMPTLLQNKFMVVTDGNMAPSSRLFIFLQAGSLILKQESPSVEFYYDDLKPYQHYVPVSYNFGDIEQKVRWAIRNDRRAKAIANNAMAYAKQYLTKEHVDCFMYRLLLRYSQFQRYHGGYHNTSWQQITTTCEGSESPAP